MSKVRMFMFVEAATFLLAASIHAGLLVSGYQHREARIAETVIGVVLLASAGLTYAWPGATRALGLTAQGFALLGTLVGITTIIVGIGPRTIPDVLYHVAIVIVLVSGLIAASRLHAGAPRVGA